MNRFALILACFCCAAAEPVLANPLSSYSTELAVLAPGGVLDRVDVYVAGREPYDSYFLQVAIVDGTMATAEALTAQFGEMLIAATGAAPGTDPEQWPDLLLKLADDSSGKEDTLVMLRQRGRQLEVMVDPVVRAVEQLPGLAAQTPGLAARAPSDFTGLRGRIKLIGVMNGLRRSSGQLERAAVNCKRIVGNLHAIVSAVPK